MHRRATVLYAALVFSCTGSADAPAAGEAALTGYDPFVPTVSAGTIDGRVDVSASGQLTYHATIQVPPGRAGLEPELALVFSSGGSESSIGVGWSLTGLSSIGRCSRTFAQDGIRMDPQLSSDDRLCLDGARLVATGGDYGGDGTTYATELESDRRIISAWDGDIAGGAAEFRVELPDGRDLTYGGSANSRIIVAFEGQPVVIGWLISEVQDPDGNWMRFTYDRTAPPSAPAGVPTHELAQIARIDYGAYDGSYGALPMSRSVQFHYAEGSRLHDVFQFGSLTLGDSSRSLTSISTHVGARRVREYLIEANSNNPAEQRRVTALRECAHGTGETPNDQFGPDLVCKPPTRFEWTDPGSDVITGGGFPTDDLYGLNTFEAHHVDISSRRPRQLADRCPDGERDCYQYDDLISLDMNGDGADDLIYVADSGPTMFVVRLGGYESRPARHITDPAAVPFTREIRPVIRDQAGAVVASVSMRHGSTYALDWNLDGLDDLLFWQQDGSISVLQSDGTDFTLLGTGLSLQPLTPQTPSTTVATWDFRAVELNGDGRTDLLACQTVAGCTDRIPIHRDGDYLGTVCRGEWVVAMRSADGTGFDPLLESGIETSCWFDFTVFDAVAPGDFDGDGLTELVIGPDPRVDATTFSDRVLRWNPMTGSIEALTSNVAGMTGKRAVDINGDGLHDLVGDVRVPSESQILFQTQYALATGIPGRFTEPLPYGPTDLGTGTRMRAEYISYGDTGQANHELCVLSMADPILAIAHALAGEPCRVYNVYSEYNILPLIPFEMNGDGRGDVLVPTLAFADRLTATGQWASSEISVLQGAGWAAPEAFETGVELRGSLTQYFCTMAACPGYVTIGRPRQMAVDGDGDGALDLIEVYDEHIVWDTDQPLVFLHNIRAQRALVSAIVDGYGARTEVDYQPVSDSSVYTPSTACGENQRCVTSSMLVVERIRRDTGVGTFRSTAYQYEDGRMDLRGRGWLGFARVRATDELTGAVTETQFDNATLDLATGIYPLAHRALRVVSMVSANALPSAPASVRMVATETVNSFDWVVTAAGTLRVRRTGQEVVRVEGMGVVSDPIGSLPRTSVLNTTWENFDSRGRARITITEEALTGASTTVTTEYADNELAWVLGVPVFRREHTLGAPGVCDYDVEWEFAPDLEHGRVESVTRNPSDDATMRRTDLLYDGFGNLWMIETSTKDDLSRTLEVKYDSDRVFPTSVKNALGHTSEVLYEPGLGIVQASQDANGNKVHHYFDAFGRERRVEAEGFGRVTTAYHRADAAGFHDVEVDSTQDGRVRLRFDRLGRRVRTTRTHARIITTRTTRYDERGRVISEGEPRDAALAEAARTTFVYDGLDRLRRIVGSEPGENIEIWYEPRTIHRRDAAWHETVAHVDGRGLTSAVIEPYPGGRTDYTYCGTGALHTVTDALGNRTYTNYDSLGRRRSLDDPDTGISFFSYNAFDELVSTTDGADREIRYDIDQLGRIFGRHDVADGRYTSWEWDTALSPMGTPILGALHQSISGDGVIDTNKYDDMGRLTGTTRQHGSTTLTTEIGYDGEGRPSTFEYPSTLGADPFVVEYVREPVSHEVVELRTTDGTRLWHLDTQSVHGRPTQEYVWGQTRGTSYTASGRINTVKVSSGIQDLDYDYDVRGLLSARRDTFAGVTDTYTHDGLGRIRGVSRTGVGVTEWYDYDAIGNLTDSHDGWRVYPPAGDRRPHGAVEFGTALAGGVVSYDSAGNATDIGDLHIEYNQLNLPRVAWDSSSYVEFEYDADGARAQKSSNTQTLYYGLYEREAKGMAIVERLQIVAPTGVIAQVERTPTSSGGTTTTHRLLFTGRQGSVESVVQSGSPTERVRYDSFGGVVSTSGDVTRDQPTDDVSVGYTGHEHDPELGLVNMGGRMFHPIMRRFLTADPFSSGVGQGLNRYSYVRNSPHAFSDPSGFQEVPDLPEPPRPPDVVYDYPGDLVCVGLPGSCDGVAEPGGSEGSDAPASERAGADVAGQSPSSSGPQTAESAPPPAPLPPGLTPPGGGLYEQDPIRLGVAVAMERLFNFPEADRGFVTPREQEAIRVGELVGDGIGLVVDVAGVVGGVIVATASVGGGLLAELPSLGSSTAVVVGGAVVGVGVAVGAAADGQRRIDRALDNIRAMSGGESRGMTPAQMNAAIRRGRAPRGIERVDVPRVPGEQLHVHLNNGSALNVDGTWKHLPRSGQPRLTSDQAAWLRSNGWTLPH